MHPHVHIDNHSGTHSLVYLDHKGHATHDGSMRGLNHFFSHGVDGVLPEHGEAFLHALVKKLDSATLVGARYCTEHHSD